MINAPTQQWKMIFNETSDFTLAQDAPTQITKMSKQCAGVQQTSNNVMI
jgi:hypothetical protein